jgi:CHAT domain-containing protein
LLWVWYVRREILGSSLGALARLYGRRGELGRASRCLQDALDVFEEGFQYRAAAVGARDYRPNFLSIYAQLFGNYLAASLDPRAEIEPGTAYRRVLAWKGAHFAAERRARKWRERPELKPVYAELQAVSAAVARSTYSLPAEKDSAAWERLYAAMRRKEEVETELAGRVLNLSQGENRIVPDAEEFRAVLPAGVALVDFLVIHTGLDWKGIGQNDGYHLLAFVVRPDRPIVRLDLGRVDGIEELVDAWRSRTQALGDPAQAASPLRRSLGQPLEPYLDGIRILLVSPDGPITRFPLAALPGRAPSTFLLEDLAVAVVPVPQLLAAESPIAPATSRLLLVGDIDFGADPGPASSPRDPESRRPGARGRGPVAQRPAFRPLPGTRRELESIRDQFTATHPGAALQVLRGGAATEAAFRSALPGSRYVHLATHGFFIPIPSTTIAQGDYWKSPQALAGHNPGLTSGITLAGVNRPPRPDREDGVLTAMEAQQLDLRGVELVVLSACETSLGSAAKGEGMMGLQRAFQVAGAGSLISSVWSVDDVATSVIMEQFYTNLWERRLPKLEALRQAQLAMLRRYDPARHRLRGAAEVEGPSPAAIAADRGAEPMRRPPTPPFFWAAFTLSGDWR